MAENLGKGMSEKREETGGRGWAGVKGQTPFLTPRKHHSFCQEARNDSVLPGSEMPALSVPPSPASHCVPSGETPSAVVPTDLGGVKETAP